MIEIREYKKAEDLIEFLLPINKFWSGIDEFETNWVFRGQWDKDWELIPKAWRENKNIASQII